VTVNTPLLDQNNEQDILADLLARTAMHDKDAFQRLYQKVSPRLLGLLVKLLQNKSEAEDLLHDVFVKLWHNAGDYRPQYGLAIAWLYTVARNKALDFLRSEKRRNFHNTSEDDSAKNISYKFDSENALAIEHCLEQLANVQRQSVLQAFYLGWTYEELAERLSIPLGTMKTRIRRSLHKLRECLSQ